MPNRKYTRPDNWKKLEAKRLKELKSLISEKKRIAEILSSLHRIDPSRRSLETLTMIEELKSTRTALSKEIKFNKRQSVEYKLKASKESARRRSDPANLEKEKENNKRWRQSETGRQYMKQYRKDWYKENSEIAIRTVTRRRARRRSNGYEFYSLQDAIDIYGTICHLCDQEIDLFHPRKVGAEGWEKSFQLDHIIPISQGGPDTLDNVRPSHARCNMNRRTKTVEEYRDMLQSIERTADEH
jgi:5-methylcytosine-specific restriction endonuclease McrA